jgi:flap endonuclease-1
MGNADLRDLAVVEPIALADLAGTTLAVDAHNWLYRYLTTTVRFTASERYTTGGEEVANLIGIVTGLPTFFEHDITPVFVFDGGASDLKTAELERRREDRADVEAKREAAAERGDAAEAARFDARAQRLTETIHETSRELLGRLDVPIVEAPGAGEAQAAHMARRGDADAVGSEDYDALLFGAPVTIRRLTGSDDPERMDFEATLDRHGLSWEGLVDAAILCGTDYNDGVPGIGPKTAVGEIGTHGDIWGVLDAHGTHIDHVDRIRNLFLDPAVTDDYEIDPRTRPDVEAARRYVVDEWEVPASEVDAGFDRVESAAAQTGLDRWS